MWWVALRPLLRSPWQPTINRWLVGHIRHIIHSNVARKCLGAAS